jgi:SpoIID/LytB domain protein
MLRAARRTHVKLVAMAAVAGAAIVAALRRNVLARAIAAFTAGALAVAGLSVVMAPHVSAAETYWVAPSSSLTIFGRGFGHGRGMSQYGAQGRALAGHTSTQILDFYYPGTTSATTSGTIRVHITADTSPNIQVHAVAGLRARDLGTNAVWTLPTATNITQWWMRAYGDHQTRLMYYSTSLGSWVPWRTLSGMAQFEGPAVTRLVLPNGQTAPYRGTLRAVDRPGADIDTVNVLSVEYYLRGVVPREAIASWKPAALQAQAVAARTYAVSKRTSAVAAGRDFDLCDTTACQVYGGYAAELTSTNSAIVATGNRIRTYGGKPILAEFSSSNGGYTAPGPVPYQVAKADSYDSYSGNGNPNASWTASVSRATAETRFGVGTIKAITITQRNGYGTWGGRVVSVDIAGSTATKTFTGDGVRSLLGLKSNWLRFDQSAVIKRWLAIGGASSPVGSPTGYEEPVRGGTAQTFAKGDIYWSSAYGAWEVYGGFISRYREIGGPNHTLGLPIAARSNGAKPGSIVQRFRVGRMFYSAATSTREVYGRIYTAYYNAGLEGGRLGPPTTYQTATSFGAQQTFQGGHIDWYSSSNTTSVVYN